MFVELKQAPPGAISREARQITQLALPMIIAQMAQVATSLVDTIMAGRVSTDDLAAVSLGANIFITFYVTLMGVVTALNPILSQQLGAQQQDRFSETARQGLWFGLLVGLFGAALMLACEPLLRAWLSLPEEVVDKVVLFIQGAAFGMPAAMMHRALHAYASSLGRPKAIMIVSLIALALNIPLNYILIHGLFGLPKLGGAGCGWATGLVFWFNCLALFAYVSVNRHFKSFRLIERFSWPNWSIYPSFLKLGIPIGLSFFVEVSLFSFIVLLITGLGTTVIAAHQSVMAFSSFLYMLPQAVSTALTIRIGFHVGAGDFQAARFIAGVGLLLGAGISLVAMVLVLLLRYPIMLALSPDAAVITLGMNLLLYAAVYQLTDAIQTVASGALRGYKLTTVPLMIHLVSFWGMGLGLGVVLGLTDWLVPAMGVTGFWAALVFSLTMAAMFLSYYLNKESKRRLLRQVKAS